MQQRLAVLAGLAGASALALILYWRNRETGAASDALEEIGVTARRLLDPPSEQPGTEPTSFLGEIAVTAKKLAATVIAPSKSTSGTRGIRNNNPGNIVYMPVNPWKGQIGTDGRFGVYDTPANGVRAIGKQLMVYRRKYGLSTVRDLIARWAPPVENNTASYISSVARRLGVDADQNIDVAAMLGQLAAAIILHENGRIPYTQSDINTWVNLP